MRQPFNLAWEHDSRLPIVVAHGLKLKKHNQKKTPKMNKYARWKKGKIRRPGMFSTHKTMISRRSMSPTCWPGLATRGSRLGTYHLSPISTMLVVLGRLARLQTSPSGDFYDACALCGCQPKGRVCSRKRLGKLGFEVGTPNHARPSAFNKKITLPYLRWCGANHPLCTSGPFMSHVNCMDETCHHCLLVIHY